MLPAERRTMSGILLKALKPEAIRLRLEATTKEAAIRELVGILDSVEPLQDRAEAERVIFAREQTMSTGMQDGLAIPHAKTDVVEHLVVALGLKPEGLDFDCADGQPARILFVTLSPTNKAGPHIQLLAEVTGVLRHQAAREAVLQAKTPEEVIAALLRKY
jgi:mannitol/fructose-specific phosphotransferase system IIA component (Ntr-type)